MKWIKLWLIWGGVKDVTLGNGVKGKDRRGDKIKQIQLCCCRGDFFCTWILHWKWPGRTREKDTIDIAVNRDRRGTVDWSFLQGVSAPSSTTKTYSAITCREAREKPTNHRSSLTKNHSSHVQWMRRFFFHLLTCPHHGPASSPSINSSSPLHQTCVPGLPPSFALWLPSWPEVLSPSTSSTLLRRPRWRVRIPTNSSVTPFLSTSHDLQANHRLQADFRQHFFVATHFSTTNDLTIVFQGRKFSYGLIFFATWLWITTRYVDTRSLTVWQLPGFVPVNGDNRELTYVLCTIRFIVQ